jgi:paraquat-inducible protein B
MSEQGPGPGRPAGVGDAVVQTKSRVSIVWLIPLIAALVGGFVAWRAFSERGPAITIIFKSAEGLEAGKTQIKYKDVEVGLVETVALADDLSDVIVHARMVKGSDDYLTKKTQFWVVKPRIAGGEVSGLSTLLSGSYIALDPVREGKRTRRFQGLDVAPVVTTSEAGKMFELHSDRAGAIEVGSPVFFRKIQVGKVVSSRLSDKVDDDTVTTKIFVRAPYDQRVHPDSRFWNASGIDVSIGADGVQINTESMISILVGGIGFDSPPGEHGEAAPAEAVFPLYASREDAHKRHYTNTVTWLLRFNQSVRGLKVGAPVEFRGIEMGEVTDVRGEFDRATNQFVIPVLAEIEPERFLKEGATEAERRTALDKLVAEGLRAQLKSGNLLTGQLIVAIDVFPDVKPAQIVWTGPYPQFPTIPTPLEEITASLTKIVERISKLPIEQIGEDLQGSLAALEVTLKRSESLPDAIAKTLETTDRTLSSLGPDSSVNAELRRALLELSDAARALGLAAQQFETQPNSVIFGKKGSK